MIHQYVKKVHELYEELRGSRPGPVVRFPTLPVVAPCSSSGRPAWATAKEGNGIVALSRESKVKRDMSRLWHDRVSKILKGTDYAAVPNPDQLERIYRDLGWLAVVHADGNGLGKIFLDFPDHLDAKDDASYVRTLREFSVALEEATEAAFKTALQQLPSIKRVGKRRPKDLLPIVPLVLGGDDLTAICDGEYALPFARAYLRAFEHETSKQDMIAQIAKQALGCARLSACAGVAIIKPHFPFHRAYELSEQLLRSAKQVKHKVQHHTQNNTPFPCSALDFHILYDSTFTDLDSIRRERLTLAEADMSETLLTAKPYVVTSPEQLNGATGREWVELHKCSKLSCRIATIRAEGDDGRRLLPNTQLHDLREGLFMGRAEADARMGLIRKRYAQEGIDGLLEGSGDPASLSSQNENVPFSPK